MAEADLCDLERTIRDLPDVLGCVILANPDGSAAEIQAFTRLGSEREELERSIVMEAASRGLSDGLGQVFVFELEAESHLGDRESLERAAEFAEQEARSKGPIGVLHALGTLHSLAETAPEDAESAFGRIPLRRVILSSSTWRSEAQVTLGATGGEVVGRAVGDKSAHGLNVVAEATLEAAGQVVSGRDFTLEGTSLVAAFEREAVLVLVNEAGRGDVLGAALVRDAPATEAAVRATLDAINRRLAADDR